MTKNNILLMDIGNTSITCSTVKSGKLSTQKHIKVDTIPSFINKWQSSGDKSNNIALLVSVVPKTTNIIKKKLKNATLYEAGKNLPIPVNNPYKIKKNLGIDRLINAYGMKMTHKVPSIVIDYGTAITFDIISKNGKYEGGLIVPGPELAFRSLLSKAKGLQGQKLPHFKKAALTGSSTSSSLNAGIFHGYGALTEGVIQKIKKKYGKSTYVLATGGLAANIMPYVKGINKVDPAHTLKSLYLLYKETKFS